MKSATGDELGALAMEEAAAVDNGRRLAVPYRKARHGAIGRPTACRAGVVILVQLHMNR